MRTKHLAALFVLTIGLGVSLVNSVSGATIVTNQYWILTDGYTGNFSNNRYIYVSYSNFLPYITEQVYHIGYTGTSGPLQKYDSSGNLLQYGYRWQSGSGYCVVDPPGQFFPGSMETGQTYSSGWTRKEYSDQNVYLGEGRDDIEVTVSGPESVTVPAGTFTTYKVRVDDSWRNSSGTTGTSTSYYWLAKSIGWVKLLREGVTYELVLAAPTATTGSASDIAASSATLNGTVNPNGGGTTYFFQYGTTTSYGSQTMNGNAGSGTSAVPASISVTGLSPATTYHFRVGASNSSGTSYGSDQSFTTLTDSPSVTTGSASSLTASSATLNGEVNPNGVDTNYYFEYGQTTSYGDSTDSVNAGSGNTGESVSSEVMGLDSDATYHYRIVASNVNGTSYGEDKTFTTSILYVDPLGACGGMSPCYTTIQEAVDAAPDNSTIKIVEGSYDEDIILDNPTVLIFQGGWDSTFTAQSLNTTIKAPVILRDGEIRVKNIRVR